MPWTETYEHEEFGEIAVTWFDERPERTHLIAIQADFWTPAEEIEDCLRWARSLQDDDVTRAGDGDSQVREGDYLG